MGMKMHNVKVSGVVVSPCTKRKKNRYKSYRTKKGKSRRTCRVCGKDPYPNYFFCAVCHHKIGVYEEGWGIF